MPLISKAGSDALDLIHEAQKLVYWQEERAFKMSGQNFVDEMRQVDKAKRHLESVEEHIWSYDGK